MVWLVPSPRWLVLRGRQSEVSAAWDVLGVDHADRQTIEVELQTTVNHGSSVSASSPRRNDASPTRRVDAVVKHGFFDVFARDVRSRTVMAIFLLGMQQLSGIDGVLYVSSISIHKASMNHRRQPKLCSLYQVRTSSLYPSWPHLFRSLVPRFRRLRHRYLRRDYPCPYSRRQVGSPA